MRTSIPVRTGKVTVVEFCPDAGGNEQGEGYDMKEDGQTEGVPAAEPGRQRIEADLLVEICIEAGVDCVEAGYPEEHA